MAKTSSPRLSTSVHVLRADLVGSLPEIYRTLEVRSDISLATLHRVLQAAFGWTDSHLHQFRVGKHLIADPRMAQYPEAEASGNEQEVHLQDALPTAKRKLLYEYDFGDCWEISVQTVRIDFPAPGAPRPPVARLTGGSQAAPPEDCGGLPGYYELCDILIDPQHPEHDERAAWLGNDDFDSREFDPEAIEKRLRKLK